MANRIALAPQKPLAPQKQGKIVATHCDQLPLRAHGKEGVDGSSPSEGLKYLQIEIFCCLI